MAIRGFNLGSIGTQIRVIAAILLLAMPAIRAEARQVGPPVINVPPATEGDSASRLPSPAELLSSSSLNPLTILDAAGSMLPGAGTSESSMPATSGRPDNAKGGGLSAALNVLIVLTIVSLAPSLMLMTTCFMRIMIVLGMLKQAMGTQSIPPPQVTVALALFMTLLVMSPTIDRINTEALTPYRAGEITSYDELWGKARQPIRDFMFDQIEATGNWSSLYMVLNYRGVDTSRPELMTRADVDMISLIPAYMLSELKVAFLMGFRVYPAVPGDRHGDQQSA
jgi:flagellar biosynthetic protein FliP